MVMKLIWPVLSVLVFFACAEKSSERTNDADSFSEDTIAQRFVDEAIEAHGVDALSQAVVEFDFRGRKYVSRRNDGFYTYERTWQDTLNGKPVIIRDVLDNEGFARFVYEEKIPVRPEMAARYGNSINSVIYFALLPYFLNDPAVNKKYLGSVTINGEPYEKVQITFDREGGGKDYQDVFIYWFHSKKKTMDYFAYSYETDEGGIRFREAYNIRNVNGVRFANYINYKVDDSKYRVEETDSLFEEGLMEEVSRIKTESVKVKIGDR